MTSKASFFSVGLMTGILLATGIYSFRGKAVSATDAPAKTVLKLGHGLPTDHPAHAAMAFMKAELEKCSGGTMTLDIYPGAVLGSETECIEQLQNGALAITKASTSPLEQFCPEMAVFSMPYVFRNREHYWKILDGAVGKELLSRTVEKKLRGLCYYDAGSRNFYTKEKPALSPADLKGLKIRVMNSRTTMDMISAMGASPTPIAWGELYTALQQGVVDGAENNAPSYFLSRHYEVCKHFSMDEHTRVPDILLMSEIVWKKLTPRQQQWIQASADKSSVFQRNLWKAESDKALESCKKMGVKVYYPDLKPFIECVRPMLESYQGTPVGALLKRIEAEL